jgi:hypothetical protein
MAGVVNGELRTIPVHHWSCAPDSKTIGSGAIIKLPDFEIMKNSATSNSSVTEHVRIIVSTDSFTQNFFVNLAYWQLNP